MTASRRGRCLLPALLLVVLAAGSVQAASESNLQGGSRRINQRVGLLATIIDDESTISDDFVASEDDESAFASEESAAGLNLASSAAAASLAEDEREVAFSAPDASFGGARRLPRQLAPALGGDELGEKLRGKSVACQSSPCIALRNPSL